MPNASSGAPAKLSIFASRTDNRTPLAGLCFFAEVVVQNGFASPPVNPRDDAAWTHHLRDALAGDAEENVQEPQPWTRLAQSFLDALHQEMNAAVGTALLKDDPDRFLAEVVGAVHAALQGAPLRDATPEALDAALKAAIQNGLRQRGLLVTTPDASAKPVSYPLGVLMTDHAGYLSYDLSHLPKPVAQAVAQAVEAKRSGSSNTPGAAINVYPAVPGEPFSDALAQKRFSSDAIVARIDLEPGSAFGAQSGLRFASMQRPSLSDWYLSPGSFATSPGLLVGADGCETVLPSDLALHEYSFYQTIRLSDLTIPQTSNPAGSIQLGVVNEFRVAWYPLGHSLGQILYSLPLAPGESVNLAVVDWTRRDETQRKERTTVDEQLVHNEHRDRTISETTAAAVQEYQHGSSFMGGISGALGGSSGSLSAGVAGSLGGSTASSSGSRNLTASTVQKLADNIGQASSSARELQSTVVVQSNQAEHEAIETRTVVNYNHSHALTILYYEVLRHFRVVTELVRQRPAALVRASEGWLLKDGKLDGRAILDARDVLVPSLLDARHAPAFDALDRLVTRGGPLADLNNPLPAGPLPPGPGTITFDYFEFELTTGGFFKAVDDHKNHIDIRSSLLKAHLDQIDLVNLDGEVFLNNFGAFSEPFKTNTFVGRPKSGASVAWDDITAIAFLVEVNPEDGDTAKVSFSHVKLTGLSAETGRPGVLLVDQSYENGHLIITNRNDEANRRMILPALRPPPQPQLYSPADLQDRAACESLIAHLQAHKDFYSCAVASGLNGFERSASLDAISLSDGTTALSQVENRPLDVISSFVVYPSTDPTWNDRILASVAGTGDPEAAAAQAFDERLVSLPTRGVFAEAKLGHCNASEVIDNTRFWDWQQSPIPHFAPDIAATTPVTPQPVQQNATPTGFPTPIVNIVNPPAAPDPTGLAAAMNVLATPNLFRDMSGTAQVADLLKNLADNAVRIASGKAGGGGGAGVAPRGSTGGVPVGGPRATPTQPSAANRDLQDFGSVLSRAQTAGLITPAQAREAFADAAIGRASPDLTASQTATDALVSLTQAEYQRRAQTKAADIAAFTPASESTLVLWAKEVTPPAGLNVLNWTHPGVKRYTTDSKGNPLTNVRRPDELIQVILHETVGWANIGASAPWSVHFTVGPDNTVYQHCDGALFTVHGNQMSDFSIGIEFTNWSWFKLGATNAPPLVPPGTTAPITDLQGGAVGGTTTDDRQRVPISWMHGTPGNGVKGDYYVLPPLSQLQTVTALVRWLTGGLLDGAAIDVPRVWRQLIQHPADPARTLFAMTFDPTQQHAEAIGGIYPHILFQTDHTDGGAIGLFTWLAIDRQLAEPTIYTVFQDLLTNPSLAVAINRNFGGTSAVLQCIDVTALADMAL